MSISELSKAIQQNDMEAVKSLLENGADFNSYREVILPGDDWGARIYAISDAVTSGNAEIISFMLARDPNFLLIHKDECCTVKIDFYARPAILEFRYNDVPTYIDITGKFICGSRTDSVRFAKWLTDVESELENIVWEWNSGKDEFKLISRKIV